MPYNKYRVLLLTFFLLTCATIAFGQDPEDEDVRGIFVKSRASSGASGSGAAGTIGGNSSGNSSSTFAGDKAKPNTRPATKPKPPPRANTASNRPKPTTPKPSTGNSAASNSNVNTAHATPLGLGYTLFMRDERGGGTRVDPGQTFRAGDRVRFLFETSTSGYVYVFYTENDGAPLLLFPNIRLGEGHNNIAAHVPFEIPSSLEAEERNRWFVFDANPATERLFLVLTREPLTDVPTGAALSVYCRNNTESCYWKPDTAWFARLKARHNETQVLTVKDNAFGQQQSTTETDAVARGLGLEQSAPEPSVIRVNATANSNLLLTTLELNHR